MSDDDSSRGEEPVPSSPIPTDEAEARTSRAMKRVAALDLDGALREFVEIEQALRFDQAPERRVQWARCLNGLGFIELMDAKEHRAGGAEADGQGDTDFRRGLKNALARFDQALAAQTDAAYRASVTGNKAYVLALLGETAKARALLEELFRARDRELYDGQVRDTERFPVPEDRAVRQLIDDAWETSAGG